jgi:ketosteroid isomerase-like protein
MAETKKENAIRDFIDALCKKDVDNAMIFFADNATWTAAEGVFKGIDEIKKYTLWMINSLSGLAFSDAGVGVVVDGKNAFYEYTMTGTFEGKKIETPGVCIYQFEGDKCIRHFTLVDRLSMARQAAGGFIAKKAVKSIVGIMEKGLR